ncbi:MAG: HEAT repeat domain-containing protein [Gemmatimonadales bacterium]
MLHRLMLAAATTAALALAPRAPQGTAPEVPRAAWAPSDPGDSLYRVARETLNKGDYRKAADLFNQLYTRYPKSAYAGDACYWQAFALYRVGSTADLRAALAALDLQRSRYPTAATRGDAESLGARIQGELARRGDPNAAEAVAASAAAVAGPPKAATAPRAATAPATPVVPAAAVAVGGARGVGPAGAAPVAAVAGSGGCSDEEDDARVAALNALMMMDAARAQPVLQKVLARRDSGSVCLRQKAVFILAQENTPQTADLLLSTARNDPSQEVRGEAVFWLSQVGGPQALAALDSILRTPGNEEIRGKALFALSQINTPEARRSLRNFAGGAGVPPDLQKQAIFFLSQSGTADDAQFLRTLYPKLTDADVKESVLFALSQQPTPENQKWLLQVAGDPTQAVELRKQALFAASQSGVDVSEFIALYDKSSDVEMKQQIIFVLSQNQGQAATDKLFQIARSEANPVLRKQAIFWLSQSNDPRAAKLLEEIVSQ